jgi:2-polyprenyl-3-methyl-5-hydroxy-6-metoxy-1,4-benzoquinol methylase
MYPPSLLCPVCEKPNCTNFLFLSGKHGIYQCNSCGVEFLYPQPSDQDLAKIYSEQYFLGSESEVARKRVAALKRATAALYLAKVRPLVNATSPRLLEIGCGSGDFLLEASSHGFTVEGLEYSPHAVETANRRLSKQAVQVGSLESNELPADYYDVAVGFDVIEHVRDPAYALARLHRSLKPEGLLVLATPSLDSWSHRLLGKHWMEYKTEHLTYFGQKSLKYILQRLGFAEIRFHSNYKVLSFDYIYGHFERYPVPIISPVLKLLRKLLPDWIAHKPVKVVASGTMVTARKAYSANRSSAGIVAGRFPQASRNTSSPNVLRPFGLSKNSFFNPGNCVRCA